MSKYPLRFFICKVNAWNMYHCHCQQNRVASRKVQSLLNCSKDIVNALMHRTTAMVQRGAWIPSKRANLDPVERVQRKKIDQSYTLSRCKIWSIWILAWNRLTKKDRCRLCQAYSRTKCTKCGINLCLLKESNCFKAFHKKYALDV